MNNCSSIVALSPIIGIGNSISSPIEKSWQGRKYLINNNLKKNLISSSIKGTLCLLGIVLSKFLVKTIYPSEIEYAVIEENETIFPFPEFITASVMTVSCVFFYIERKKTRLFKIKKIVEELPLHMIPAVQWIKKNDLICITLEKELDLSKGIIRGIDEANQVAFVLKINDTKKEMVLYPLQSSFKDKSYEIEINKETVILKNS